MPQVPHPIRRQSSSDRVQQARNAAQQKRWLAAESILLQEFKQHPERVVVRGELARGWLALGHPHAAQDLLEPCLEQGIQEPVVLGLYWRSKVRTARSSTDAVRWISQALKGSLLPEDVIEEWRMITAGLITAGWHNDARAWLMALGAHADSIELAPFW